MSLTGEENTNRCIFHMTKNNILQIRILVTRKLKISENVMSCVCKLVIDSTASCLNTENPPIKVLPFNCRFSL